MKADILAIVAAFVIGSIPFGYLIGRLFFSMDIRRQGSGNIGAANALRTIGKRGAIAVLTLDAAKGFMPVFVARLFGLDSPAVALIAAAAVLGHCFSPWLRWKGGKGVATSFGAIFGLSWLAGLVCVGAWVLGALATAYSSVGSIAANIVAPVALWILTRNPAFTGYGVFAALLIAWTHRDNIERLRAGTENSLSFLRRRTS
ncbi:MAG: glycerol-3-phosphate 1-O-acyltransferase PlsY [Candidatus Eremiobacteraeota bacterium]|nr:glycerol-3-phosphate 1-O-acyltransferase PlsY [Candidatus Eremiobacteraeota bacterium]